MLVVPGEHAVEQFVWIGLGEIGEHRDSSQGKFAQRRLHHAGCEQRLIAGVPRGFSSGNDRSQIPGFHGRLRFGDAARLHRLHFRAALPEFLGNAGDQIQWRGTGCLGARLG
ncbi:MAG: hypothetical protein WCC64_01545, partial [Aliidongia sp.]